MGVTPAASSIHVRPLGSSRRARGFPAASATMRSTTPGRMGVDRGRQQRRRHRRRRGHRLRVGQPARSGNGSRVANSSATRSACRRRATKASVWVVSLSSHWASSTRQSSGCRSAVADRRLSTARPTGTGSGAGPLGSPTRFRGRPVAGRRSAARIEEEGAQLVESGKRQFDLGLNAARGRTTRKSRAEAANSEEPISPRRIAAEHQAGAVPPWWRQHPLELVAHRRPDQPAARILRRVGTLPLIVGGGACSGRPRQPGGRSVSRVSTARGRRRQLSGFPPGGRTRPAASGSRRRSQTPRLAVLERGATRPAARINARRGVTPRCALSPTSLARSLSSSRRVCGRVPEMGVHRMGRHQEFTSHLAVRVAHGDERSPLFLLPSDSPSRAPVADRSLGSEAEHGAHRSPPLDGLAVTRMPPGRRDRGLAAPAVPIACTRSHRAPASRGPGTDWRRRSPRRCRIPQRGEDGDSGAAT